MANPSQKQKQKPKTGNFLDKFERDCDKIDGVITIDEPPRYWTSFGNHAVNRVMSGSFYRGIPQGRITAICGPSSAGKSFLVGNLCKQAQLEGSIIVAIDSENALDKQFMTAIGVDTTSGYKYISLSTISQATKVVQTFLEQYKSEFGGGEDVPNVLIVVDSLDYLMSDAEAKAADSGDIQFDQGQHTRMLKSMLRTWVQLIKGLNVSIVVTKQVYKARQDQLLAGEGAWVINDAMRYACSQILLATRLKLKDEGNKDPLGSIVGIRLKVEGFKTRFCAPFSVSTVAVPYATGMDQYSGIFDIAVHMGIVTRSGAWYKIEGDETSYRGDDIKNSNELMDRLVQMCEAKNVSHFDTVADLTDVFVEVTDNTPVKRRTE